MASHVVARGSLLLQKITLLTEILKDTMTEKKSVVKFKHTSTFCHSFSHSFSNVELSVDFENNVDER